jgi:hypothetical protein
MLLICLTSPKFLFNTWDMLKLFKVFLITPTKNWDNKILFNSFLYNMFQLSTGWNMKHLNTLKLIKSKSNIKKNLIKNTKL